MVKSGCKNAKLFFTEPLVCKKCESLVNVTHEILFHYKPKIRKGKVQSAY